MTMAVCKFAVPYLIYRLCSRLKHNALKTRYRNVAAVRGPLHFLDDNRKCGLLNRIQIYLRGVHAHIQIPQRMTGAVG
jgi:hypothetical protein